MHTFLVILDTNDSKQAISAKELARNALAQFDADTGPVCGPDGQPISEGNEIWHTFKLHKGNTQTSAPASRSAARPVNADGHNVARVAFFGMTAWALISVGLIAYLY